MSELPTLPYGTALEGQAASDWAVAILEALHAPITEANVYSFAGWFRREGGGGQNNPMNTTLGSQYPAINSDGVRSFPTPEIGVQQTVATLEDGYVGIVDSFRAGVGLEHPNAVTAQELSRWSGAGYSFIEPVVVPMPPAPKPVPSYHYDRFDTTVIQLPHGRNSERNVVENYDKQRKIAHPTTAQSLALLEIEENLGALAQRIVNNEHSSNDPDGEKDWRTWRHAQIIARRNGEIVKPS